MTVRVPVIAGEQRAWNRRTADAINRLINGTESNEAAMAAIDRAMPHSIPVTITADHVVADGERWIVNDKAGSACVLTLPAAPDFAGREIHVKTIQAQAVNSLGATDVVALGSAVAGNSIVAGTAGKWATLVSNGSNWVIMAAG
jgi:hypothetical protein